MWFRSDLRISDNTALSRAAAAGEVVGLFVVSPGEWSSHDLAPVRVDLMLRTVSELAEGLGKLNIPLLVVRAETGRDVPRLVLEVARRSGCDGLFFNREYEIDEAKRDEATTELFGEAGLKTEGCTDQVVLAPGDVRTGEGRAFTVFTPFKRAWIRVLQERGAGACAAAPRKQGVVAMDVPQPWRVVSDCIEGFDSAIDAKLWPAGEGEARRRLNRFVAKRIEGYEAGRNAPADDATSVLSPYLAIGAISPRQCLNAAIEANPVERGSALDSGNPGVTCWISELIWREFYVHVAAAFPRVCMGRAFKPATERIAWRRDKAEFKRWQEGRTGFPIVDAGMRQLSATGWMHNRLRMITAMFLTKDLLIDWRWGERHFMRSLVDGFFASNNGGWQWSASTGTDAAPYFRIFNPTSQSRTSDPRGEYIRRWVPELAGLDGDEIHDPSSLPPLARAGLEYPEPMVEHAKARDRVMAAFGAIRPE